MQIESRIAGIPCLIEVDRVFVQKALGLSCDSDWDAAGYAEVEFTVLDRRGRPAPWLEKKLTREMECEIEDQILRSRQ